GWLRWAIPVPVAFVLAAVSKEIGFLSGIGICLLLLVPQAVVQPPGDGAHAGRLTPRFLRSRLGFIALMVGIGAALFYARWRFLGGGTISAPAFEPARPFRATYLNTAAYAVELASMWPQAAGLLVCWLT